MRTADVLAAISEATDTASLRHTLNNFANSVGMDGAYVINYNPSAGLQVLDDRPEEWLTRYQKHGYIHFDPIAYSALAGTEPFTWEDCVAKSFISQKQKMLMSEARDFGLNHGYNTVASEDNYISSTCCFYTRSVADFLESMSGHKHIINVVGAAIQSKFNALTTIAKPRPKLSPRELECLTWAAQGKTNDEIGTILNLSGNTVNSYLGTASSKLGVRSKIHAIVKAIQLKIIFPL